MNPAYSSQTCSNPTCGYVDKSNRKSQARFHCRCCGHKIHADVNGARNLEGGRSAFDRTLRLTKADSLRLTVSRHLERLKARGRVTSADPHGSNRYFGGRLTLTRDRKTAEPETTRSGGRCVSGIITSSVRCRAKKQASVWLREMHPDARQGGCAPD